MQVIEKPISEIKPYHKVEHEGVNYLVEGGAVQSIEPPEAHFGFSYWSLMIPPYKPKEVLQLGCGRHTIPKLIEKIWGEVNLTCNGKGDAFKCAESLHKDGLLYDFIIVDIYQDATPHPDIFRNYFLHCLYHISSGLIAINAQNFDQKAPYQLYFDIVLKKTLNNNVVTFLKHKNDNRQYFVIKP